MNTTEIQTLLSTMSDQEVEVLLRLYTSTQLERLLGQQDASSYYCRLSFAVTPMDKGEWAVTGYNSKENTTLVGEVLSITVTNLVRIHDIQRDNKLLLLEDKTDPTEEIPF